MTARKSTKPDYYAIAWRLPLIVWQGLFFVGPLLFMVAMSFFLVKNYRMEVAFQFSNWQRMLSKDFFWDAYFFTLWLALLATIITSLVAFPASYFLAFKASERLRRWAIFFLIIPFFTSYLVRVFAWQVILAQSGVINAGLSYLGLGAPPPNASWGRLLQEAQGTVYTAPIGAIAPGHRFDVTVLDADHPLLAGRAEDSALDTWIFSGGNALVKHVFVGGAHVVKDHHHINEDQIARNFRAALRRLDT